MGSVINFLPRSFQRAVWDWCRCEGGVTAIEYGLIAALVVLGAMVGFTAFGIAFADFTNDWTQKILAILG